MTDRVGWQYQRNACYELCSLLCVHMGWLTNILGLEGSCPPRGQVAGNSHEILQSVWDTMQRP